MAVDIPAKYRLFCQVLDEGTPFVVDVGQNELVDDLKTRIKEKLHPLFDNIPANFLNLWKVDYDPTRGPLTGEVFASLEKTDMQSWKKIERYFDGLPPEEHVHVVVVRLEGRGPVSRRASQDSEAGEPAAKKIRLEDLKGQLEQQAQDLKGKLDILISYARPKQTPLSVSKLQAAELQAILSSKEMSVVPVDSFEVPASDMIRGDPPYHWHERMSEAGQSKESNEWLARALKLPQQVVLMDTHNGIVRSRKFSVGDVQYELNGKPDVTLAVRVQEEDIELGFIELKKNVTVDDKNQAIAELLLFYNKKQLLGGFVVLTDLVDTWRLYFIGRHPRVEPEKEHILTAMLSRAEALTLIRETAINSLQLFAPQARLQSGDEYRRFPTVFQKRAILQPDIPDQVLQLVQDLDEGRFGDAEDRHLMEMQARAALVGMNVPEGARGPFEALASKFEWRRKERVSLMYA